MLISHDYTLGNLTGSEIDAQGSAGVLTLGCPGPASLDNR